MLKACKFGGTSVASSDNIKKCRDIIASDESRRFIVVSAPGKNGADSEKITDLLSDCYDCRFDDKTFDALYDKIGARFREIAIGLNIDGIENELNELYKQIKFHDVNLDYVISRGEYLNAKIIARYLGYEFLDAANLIRFRRGELSLSETAAAAQKLDKTIKYVIPGFYGIDENGHIKTFSRGGSDITGAVVANVFGCDIYENWTDVDGICVCDPKVVPFSKKNDEISYRELREMSYMGASVLHAETLLPLYDHPIPIVLKNTFNPSYSGTTILKKRVKTDNGAITCITGKKDYSCIRVSKMMLDKELGFVRKVTEIFEEYNINISHTHSGLDTLSFFVEKSEYKKISPEDFIKEIKAKIKADKIKYSENIALIAVIGHHLSGQVGMVARIFNVLAGEKISVKTIYQSVSECNIIIGIEENKLGKCIKSLYAALIG